MPATRKIDLPTIQELRRVTKSLAMLDAILSPDWGMRYYSFNSKWGEREQTASMRNGSGDEWFVLFSPAGAGLKGFAHEAPAAARSGELWARVRTDLPHELAGFRDEPAFSMQDVTFCAYRLSADRGWKWITTGAPDGAAELLKLRDGHPASYQQFAAEYYEREIPLAAVEAIFSHAPLTAAVVRKLNAEVTLAGLKPDVQEIGYPDSK